MNHKKEIENMQTHMDMLLTPEICEHAVIDITAHDLHFQIYRLLTGYQEALAEIDRLENEIWERSE